MRVLHVHHGRLAKSTRPYCKEACFAPIVRLYAPETYLIFLYDLPSKSSNPMQDQSASKLLHQQNHRINVQHQKPGIEVLRPARTCSLIHQPPMTISYAAEDNLVTKLARSKYILRVLWDYCLLVHLLSPYFSLWLGVEKLTVSSLMKTPTSSAWSMVLLTPKW